MIIKSINKFTQVRQTRTKDEIAIHLKDEKRLFLFTRRRHIRTLRGQIEPE
jgi:predicted ribosome-associated RNA-binding protein Tma20